MNSDTNTNADKTMKRFSFWTALIGLGMIIAGMTVGGFICILASCLTDVANPGLGKKYRIVNGVFAIICVTMLVLEVS